MESEPGDEAEKEAWTQKTGPHRLPPGQLTGRPLFHRATRRERPNLPVRDKSPTRVLTISHQSPRSDPTTPMPPVLTAVNQEMAADEHTTSPLEITQHPSSHCQMDPGEP
jgi:hypothetical protein